ncbi:MAG: dicarboxylate/amino acid:cation symporter [Pseudomonadota bacterium]
MTSAAPSKGFISYYKSLSLGVKILVWLGIGIVVGIVAGEDAVVVRPVGDLFIKLLLMAAIPLVFFNLVAGITSLSDIRILGRLGLRTVIYYVGTTSVALTLGLGLAHWLKPGEGMQLSEPVDKAFGDVPSVTNVIIDLFPENVFRAFSSGNVAQVVVFAIFIGIATLLLPEDSKEKLKTGFVTVAMLLRELVRLVLYFAPFGVGALAAATVGEYGNAIFGPLAKFIGSVWLAHLIMMTVYMIVLFVMTRRSPFGWLKLTAPLYATTAATCSSLASLVVSMNVAQNRLRIPERIYSFTLPLGAQLNKDGTAIMLTTVLLFTAQAAGVEFSLAEQFAIVLIGLILSEGSGGIPGGGLVIALIFVESFNLPLEIAGIVAGIYRLIDMGGTTVNCMGDLVWTTILSDLEERRTSSGDSEGETT